MKKFREYDTVIALRSFENIPKGCVGVVLMSSEIIKSYIVEFVDENGITIDTVEVTEDEIDQQKVNAK